MSWAGKGRVFEYSYDEVLSALKHQDDKLNRTLTAIAFLTATGVAIFVGISSKVPAPRFAAEPRLVVTTFFFVVFLSSVVFALVFALAAIGPSEALPRLRWRAPEEKIDKWPSLLFYARIVHDGKWPSHLRAPLSWLDKSLAMSFHDEALTIARRVDFKVARSRESGACVQLAVLSLSLLGLFSLVDLSLATRWWIASGLLIGMLALPLWDGFLMLVFNFKPPKQMRERATAYAAVAIGAIFGTVLLVTAPSLHSHWWALAYVLATILMTRLAVAHARLFRVATFLLVGTAAAGPAVLVAAAWT